jgi:hypothetical protein
MLRSSTRATDPRPCFLADGERGAQWPHGDHTGAPALANPGALLHIPAGGCGCSSGVEHHVANVRVVGSNPIARSNLSVVAGAPAARTCATGRADAAQRWAPRRSQHCHPSWTGDIGDPGHWRRLAHRVAVQRRPCGGPSTRFCRKPAAQPARRRSEAPRRARGVVAQGGAMPDRPRLGAAGTLEAPRAAQGCRGTGSAQACCSEAQSAQGAYFS